MSLGPTDVSTPIWQGISAGIQVATFAWTVAKDRKGGYKTTKTEAKPFSTLGGEVKRHAQFDKPVRYVAQIDPVLEYSTEGKIRPDKAGSALFLQAVSEYAKKFGEPMPVGTEVGQIPDGSGRLVLYKKKPKTLGERGLQGGEKDKKGYTAVTYEKGKGFRAPDFLDHYDMAEFGWVFTLKWSLPCTISFARVVGTDNRPHIDAMEVAQLGQVAQPNHSTLDVLWTLTSKEEPTGYGVAIDLQTTIAFATKACSPVTRRLIVWADGRLEVDGVLAKTCPELADLKGDNPVPAELRPDTEEYLAASKGARRVAGVTGTTTGHVWKPDERKVKEALRVHVKKLYGVHYSDARGQARVDAVFSDVGAEKVLLFLLEATRLRGTDHRVARRLRTRFKNVDEANSAITRVRSALDEQFKSYKRPAPELGKPDAEAAKATARAYLAQLHELAHELKNAPSRDTDGWKLLQRRMDHTAVAGLIELVQLKYGRAEGEVRRFVENWVLLAGGDQDWFDERGATAPVSTRAVAVAAVFHDEAGGGVEKPPRYVDASPLHAGLKKQFG